MNCPATACLFRALPVFFSITVFVCTGLQQSVAQPSMDSDVDDASQGTKGSAYINLIGGVPFNQFRRNAPGVWALGVEGGAAVTIYQKQNMRLELGANAGYMIYGWERISESIFISGFWDEATLTRTNSMAMLHGMARIVPTVNFPIQPFAEVMAGGRLLYTRAVLRHPDYEEPIDSRTEEIGGVLSLGAAVGASYKITRSVQIQARVLFLTGSKTDYLRRGSVVYDPATDEYTYNTLRSQTDMLLTSFGASFLF